MNGEVDLSALIDWTEAIDLPRQMEVSFGHWQKMAELQVQFVTALGEAKLQAARAELAQAVAAQHWEVARMKAAWARDLEWSLRHLRRQRVATARTIERLGRQARSAAKIRSAEDLPASQLSLLWGAYTVFERLTPEPVLAELSQLTLSSSARTGSDFVCPSRPHEPVPDVPDTVDNALALLSWMRHHRLVARRGTEAYRLVIRVFATIASVADRQIQWLQQALRDLEQRTYDTWQPVVLAALPDNIDIKKLISIGTK